MGVRHLDLDIILFSVMSISRINHNSRMSILLMTICVRIFGVISAIIALRD